VRVDFGGGWTDVPPYCDEQGGFVCNMAIARYATASLVRHLDGSTRPPDPSAPEEHALALAAMRRSRTAGSTAELRISSDFPVGAGLGGSSAAGVAAVAVLAAARGERRSLEELAEESRAIEVEDLGIAGGRQDHYAAAFGGALALEFGDGVRVRRLELQPGVDETLQSCMLILYTGRSRISGETITGVLGAYESRKPDVVAALQRIHQLARLMPEQLVTGNVEELGHLVGEHWIHQRSLHPAITTAEIDEIIAIAESERAWGGKALGASGGGCVVILAAPERIERITRRTAGIGTPLPFCIDRRGVHVLPAAEAVADGGSAA